MQEPCRTAAIREKGRLKRNDKRLAVFGLLMLVLASVIRLVPAFAQEGDVNIDINAFEEIRPEIQEIDPGASTGNRGLETIEVKPIDLGAEPIEFEEYRPAEPEPAPVVAAPEPEPTPPPPPPVVAAPETPVVKMVEQGPVLPPAKPAPLIPVEPPPEREKLRVPEEIQVAQSYRPESMELTLDDNYQQELQDLQRQLALLRERVIETKSRIITYGERVSKGFTAGTRVLVRNENALGEDFVIDSVTYFLDGHQIYSKKFAGDKAALDDVIYKGSILPGKHKIDMEVVVHGDEGMFDFGHGARLKLTTSEYFTANEGKQLNLSVRLFDKGGTFTSIQNRPGISFEVAEEDAY